MYYPDLEQARELATKYNRIPVYKEMDISEPGILMLLKAIQEEHDMIFLESAHGDGSESRFSFIGYNPHTVYYFVSPYVIERKNGNSRIVGNDLFGFIKEKTSAYSSPSFEDYGNFNGGLAGYLGYECVNQTGILRRPVRESNSIPQVVLMDLDDFICHDNVLGKFYISTSIYPTEEGLFQTLYNDAQIRLKKMEDELINKLKNTVITYMPSFTKEWEPNFRESYKSFTDKVRTVKKLIEDGEALQVVLSMRADLPEGVDPYRFYLKLRSLNPSPYMFFLKSGPIVITGSSPEIHVLVAEGKVILKPIAGTVPRGKTEEENNANKQHLLSDEKERAEHLMLVDLARNDLARIARPESVKVTEFMQPEDYSHVIHLVSQVEATLEENAHAADVLRETFPAGTVSGAPKVRAMEIIDDLEKDAREAYAGAVGYIGYNGYTDTCITIRTAYFTPNGNYIQAGAGIVADSDPDGEFNEICNKLRALSVSMPFARG